MALLSVSDKGVRGVIDAVCPELEACPQDRIWVSAQNVHRSFMLNYNSFLLNLNFKSTSTTYLDRVR